LVSLEIKDVIRARHCYEMFLRISCS